MDKFFLADGEIPVLQMNSMVFVCPFIDIWMKHMEDFFFQVMLFSPCWFANMPWNMLALKREKYGRDDVVCCNKLQVSFSCSALKAALIQLAAAGCRMKTCIWRWGRLTGGNKLVFSGMQHCKNEEGARGGGIVSFSFLGTTKFNSPHWIPKMGTLQTIWLSQFLHG